MVRMSDILKKAKEKEGTAKEERQKKPFIESAQQEAPLRFVKPMKEVMFKADGVEKPRIKQRPEVREQKGEKAETSEVRISPLVMKGPKAASSKESLELYKTLASLMKEALKKNIDHKSIDVKQIMSQIEKIIEQLSSDDKKLLELALIKNSKDEYCLSFHSINVCIFAIEIGLGLGYEKSKLMKLGISALFHDVGMAKYQHLSNLPRELTDTEYNEIKNHPIKGREISEKIKNLDKVALHVTHQEHERLDGSGYPQGLKKDSIHECAKIVALVDIYEALLHRRAQRREFLASEAVQQILSEKAGFEYKLIKLLIERIGIFPIGSYIQLNTKEIGQVVGLNHASPLRPVVKILLEPDKEKPKEDKVLDLTSHPTIYIRKGLRKDELSR